MSFNKTLARAGLIVALALFAPVAFAQSPQSPGGGTVPPAPAKDAPSAPGTESAVSAEHEASSIAAKIEKARKQGKDVSKAEAEEKKGEAALQAGYKSEAGEHFERAKQALGTM
jgi:hypothetical protein